MQPTPARPVAEADLGPGSARPRAAAGTARLAGGSPVDDILAAVLAELAEHTAPPTRPAVLDCGGGSGSRAVPLAVLGATVTVIDSSIDALAILGRRAAEAGVGDRVTGVQADVENLAELTEPESVDLVLVHGLLDAMREPAQVFAAAARAVATAGYLSVVVPNPVAAVLARALAGELSAALAELTRALDPSAPDSPLNLDLLRALAQEAGLEVVLTQGLGAFSSTVPGWVLDGQPAARATLAALDRHGAMLSPYREIAGQLHLLARRGNGGGLPASAAAVTAGSPIPVSTGAPPEPAAPAQSTAPLGPPQPAAPSVPPE